MNYNETVVAVARKLRQSTKHDVSEMLKVLLEVWREELLRPGGYIRIEGVGKLYVERQIIRSSGVVYRALSQKHKPVPATLVRYYFRFHPSDSLRAALTKTCEAETGQPE
ncbi:MAG: hypothetical protein ACYDBJ_10680 [Aggregatilineales bacterium]